MAQVRDDSGGRRGLGRFAQGRRWDEARGSVLLALTASTASEPEMLEQAHDDELLGIGRAWKALETWAFCGKLAVVRELITRYPLHERDDPGTGTGGLPDEWDPRLHHEVAAALGISLVAAGKLVNLAWTLDTRLPRIGTALKDNQFDPPQVRMIVDETSVLDDEAMFARVQEIILAGRPGCRTWSDLQRLVQRAVITVDPEGARKRREKAEREHARIRFWRENCGTFAMQATGLPADEALAANARIEGRARAYKAARVAHPMDILRVMAYLDLINQVTIAQRAAWAQADAAARKAGEQAHDGEQAARDATLRNARDKARRDPAAGGTGHGQDPEAGGEPDGDGPADPHGPGGPDGGALDGGSPAGSDDGYPGDWPDGDDGGFGGGLGDEPLPEDPQRLRGLDPPEPPESPQPPDPPGETEDASAYSPCLMCRGAGGGIGLAAKANLTLPAGALG